jgi:UDP-GlcNAc:undecaprenyl-phosphate GlcNAc-1-phosphate transferase
MKLHKRATPLMGGVGVYLAFALAAFTVLPWSPPVRGLLVGGLAAVVVGILDEQFNLSPPLHLLGQIAAAIITVVAGLGVIGTLSIPVASLTTPGYAIPGVVGFLLTVGWIVAMMNTTNFLDGLDGLLTGVAALAALLLAAWAWESQRFALPGTVHHEDLLLPLALAGALLGFLPYNWHVARIFLGDSGSMFLGLAIGALALVGPTKLATALLVLIIPVLDVAWAIVRRSLRGRSFLAGDKQHVYHRMMELGMSHTATVLSLYAVCIVLGLLDLQLYKLQKLIAFVVVGTLAGAGFVVLESRANRLIIGSGSNTHGAEPPAGPGS